MIHSFLIGTVGGMRSMTPLAAVALAAHHQQLPDDHGAPDFLSNPLVVTAAATLAMAELAGDKLPFAPDRIIPPGMAARILTGAFAGAVLAPRRDRALGATLGALGACLSAYVTFGARIRAMRHADQVSTGLLEDAFAVGSAKLIIDDARRA